MSDGILMEMTIEEIRAFEPEVVVIGTGSVEPHGPVLPYGTDYYQADAVVRQGVILANKQGARALMYPTLPIGNNVNFKAFPFACRIGVQTYMQVLLDIISALEEDGIRKIVLFDGHGGNTDTLRATLRAHCDKHKPGQGAFVCIMSCCPRSIMKPPLVEDQSDHAGEMEVSMMMHIRKDLVREDKMGVFPWGPKPTVEALGEDGIYFVKPWHIHVPASAGGDVRKASAEKGRKIIEAVAQKLANLLVQLSKTPWSEKFPYT